MKNRGPRQPSSESSGDYCASAENGPERRSALSEWKVPLRPGTQFAKKSENVFGTFFAFDSQNMKITELLERAGDDLKHQRLDGSFVSMRQKKEHAEVTFSTESEVASQLARSVMTGGKAADYVGIVVWVPATAWNA
jgi:hypothetical protein